MAGTATPRGDAAILQQYATQINAAAQKYGVPAWLIGAIILHESSGQPGIVNPTSGASGLMQVLPSAHPEYDYGRLRGSGPGDIAYQIDSGARILAAHIAGAGSNVMQGVQNYAGGAAYPGSFYNELATGYKSAVDTVLGGGGDAGATGGVTGGVTQGSFSQSLVDIVGFFQRLMRPETWTRAALIAGGVIIALIGAGLAVNETRAGKAARGQAMKIGELAAAA